jgi:ferredoxin-NADP reductase
LFAWKASSVYRTDMMAEGAEARQAAKLPSAQLAYPLLVEAIHQEAAGIRCVSLVHPSGEMLPAFSAGAHIDVHIPGSGTRQYSLCGSPKVRERYRIAVLLEPDGRGGSRAMHAISVGDAVEISGPRNHFPLAGPEADRHLLLAGGIGITPIIAMMHELEGRGAPFAIHYCARSAENAAFLAELAPRVRAGRAHIHHDGGDPRRGLDIETLVSKYEPGTHIYFCGPPGFMAALKRSLGAWPPHAVHFEYFSAPESEAGRVDAPFQIAIRRTGEVFDVSASESIVDVLKARGRRIETDCRQGYCGTCITRYTGGRPEHRDTVLSEAERQKYVMICCARAAADAPLVLEL